MPTTAPAWSSKVTDVQARLRKLEGVLESSKQADGAVDLVKARTLAGKDVGLVDLVRSVRVDHSRTLLGPSDARRAFLELQVALKTAADFDANGDGRLGYGEVGSFRVTDDPARQMIFRAAIPVETRDGERPKPRVMLSLEARHEAEKIITETAAFHGATPLGAEALAWSMRARVAEGLDIHDPIVFDAVNFTESNWKAKLPLIGERYRGRGHLSDAELEARFGELSAYIAKTRTAVNSRLMMDYQAEFLAGIDLP